VLSLIWHHACTCIGAAMGVAAAGLLQNEKFKLAACFIGVVGSLLI
jgi:hypothetical protein